MKSPSIFINGAFKLSPVGEGKEKTALNCHLLPP